MDWKKYHDLRRIAPPEFNVKTPISSYCTFLNYTLYSYVIFVMHPRSWKARMIGDALSMWNIHLKL
jgi:hypothetical protein